MLILMTPALCVTIVQVCWANALIAIPLTDTIPVGMRFLCIVLRTRSISKKNWERIFVERTDWEWFSGAIYDIFASTVDAQSISWIVCNTNFCTLNWTSDFVLIRLLHKCHTLECHCARMTFRKWRNVTKAISHSKFGILLWNASTDCLNMNWTKNANLQHNEFRYIDQRKCAGDTARETLCGCDVKSSRFVEDKSRNNSSNFVGVMLLSPM